MRVELARIRPNRWRDFRIDPLDAEQIKQLKASINEHGFWGGSSVRKIDGDKDYDYEAACGFTRIEAARQAGVTHADLHVGKYDDQAMIRAYATENLTQRSGVGLSATGVVATAVRFLLKTALKGDLGQTCPRSQRSREVINGNITSGHGIGWDLVASFLDGVENISIASIKQHLANLKASGEYARIVEEVTEEIAAEQAKEREELERREAQAAEAEKEAEAARIRAEKAKTEADAAAARVAEKEAKAAEARSAKAKAKVEEKAEVARTRDTSRKAARNAAKRAVTFDLVGVGKYLKTDHQVREFRKAVSAEAFAKHIPVKDQAAIAAGLVSYAVKFQKELSADFIRTYLPHVVKEHEQSKRSGKPLSSEGLQEIEHESVLKRYKDLQHNFCRNFWDADRYSREMVKLKEDYSQIEFPRTDEFLKILKYAVGAMNKLRKIFGME